MLIALVALAAVLALAFILLPDPPSSAVPILRGDPYTTNGPVLSSTFHNVDLSGLTVIRTIKLPKIKLKLSSTYQIWVEVRLSELLFHALSFKDASARATDPTRDHIRVNASGIKADFDSNFDIHIRLIRLQEEKVVMQYRLNGNISATSNDSSTAMSLICVKSHRTDAPILQVLKSDITPGVVSSCVIKGENLACGFANWVLATSTLAGFSQGSIKTASAFVLKGLFESSNSVVNKLLRAAISKVDPYVDPSLWSTIPDSARSENVLTPLDLVAAGNTFRCHGQLTGPTMLRNITLPDFSPQLYRSGGKRAMLQSLNALTSEFQLDITSSVVQFISITKASFHYIAPSMQEARQGGSLIVTVQELHVNLKSSFHIHADVRKVARAITGFNEVSEKGESESKVYAQSLAMRFKVFLDNIPTRDDNEADTSALEETSRLRLATESITPFDRVSVSVSKLTTRSDALVNTITKALQDQIAVVASSVVKKFIEKSVKKDLRQALVEIEHKLMDVGAVLPECLRGVYG